ncbi:YciI family protein [Candidatus Marinarcus aquaticus]|uniref:GTP cyclohydrolase n=1 Tax=Candidatus Marinarcus aquaticus TaxID=2044504 RepID=A0A4Q0XLW2_9BACT|nr:YciI family protein [Candidatus Marinarcus aquaticus]RXJ54158.1 GTP cyclohydrolase [Candidatus Marinarcus aquaticus]
MFIVLLTYIKPLEVVDDYLEAHVKYLKEQYKEGNFIASGRKIPRDGGVILSKLDSKEKLQEVLKKDPFKLANVANYEIIEFVPSMTSDEYENLKWEC